MRLFFSRKGPILSSYLTQHNRHSDYPAARTRYIFIRSRGEPDTEIAAESYILSMSIDAQTRTIERQFRYLFLMIEAKLF